MKQKEVWDNVGEEWHKYRQHPVNEAMDFLKNKKGLVLDLACGSGRNFIKMEGKLIGTDFSERMLGFARKNAKKNQLDVILVKADALDLPFADDTFDAILFSSALHTIKWNRRKKVLEEVRRVSKDGAGVYISVWNRDQPRFARADKESCIPWTVKGRTYKRYYYLYSNDELESLLKKYFKGVKVFGSSERAFKKYPKNIIALARVAKSGQRRKA